MLSRAAGADTALAFACIYGGLLLARCLWLGDPLAIPLHQAQSATLILFACFMITDPRSTPDDRFGRVLFAAMASFCPSSPALYRASHEWRYQKRAIHPCGN